MKSVYLLFGDERFLIRQELSRIIAGHPGSEVEPVSGTTPEALLEKVFLPSLFAPQRTLVVSDFDFSKDADNKLAALLNIPLGITLVFIDPKLDRRTRSFKSIENIIEAIECKKVQPWEEDKLVSWIITRAKECGKAIDRQAAERLLEYVGFEMGVLSSEIEKLSVFAGDRGAILDSDIEQMVPRTGVDAFSLSNAILTRDSKKAFICLERLFMDREEPIRLLGLIASQFRTLYKTKLLMARRMERRDIARELKASPFFIGKMIEVCARYDLAELEGSINALHRANLKLKSGFDQKVEMSLLLSELIGE